VPDDPRPFDDAPDDVLERARVRLKSEYLRNQREREGRRLARRIFLAFGLILLSVFIFFLVLPLFGVWLPAYVPMLVFATIALGAVLAHSGENPLPEEFAGDAVDGEADERVLRLPRGDDE